MVDGRCAVDGDGGFVEFIRAGQFDQIAQNRASHLMAAAADPATAA